MAEGLVSVYFGATDESLTLFGFGVDSFIEAASGVGIAHMVLRSTRDPASPRDRFERTALRVTGFSFHALAIGLIVTVGINFVTGHRPETTQVGVIISLISIAVMLVLIRSKTRVGRALDSPAILADARCTTVCVYMSVVLLLSSGAYELTGFVHLDNLGAAGLAYFSFTEGRECLEQARSNQLCGCAPDHTH